MGASGSAEALELRRGQGDFTAAADVQGVLSSRFRIPTETWTLSQSAASPAFLPVNFAFRLDYFHSGFTDQFSDLAVAATEQSIPILDFSADQLLDDFAFTPVPADYRVSGINFDLTASWPTLRTQRTHVDIGVNTGLSLPFMKTRNMRSDANLLLDLLDTFSTELVTYKLGPAVAVQWMPADWLQLRFAGAAGFHRGSLENTALTSAVDVKGNYRTTDVSATFSLPTDVGAGRWMNGWFLSLGYQQSHWEFEEAALSTHGVTGRTPSLLGFDFSHESFYLGLGYDFP